MPDPERRHIAVSPQERKQLEEAKQRYEGQAGHTDWGGFLTAVVGIGLAALGIYALATLLEQSERSARVRCSACHGEFALAIPHSGQARVRVLEVDCPHCRAQLVVDLGGTT